MTEHIPTWAVIPSEGRTCLTEALAALRHQIDGIVLVTNNGYNGRYMMTPKIHVIHDPGPDRNISRWWNIGLDAVSISMSRPRHPEWNVVVLNDDTVMGPGSVDVLTAGLRRHDGAQLAFCGPEEKLLTTTGEDRVTGWCFALRGEGNLRADESLRWWYGDNDLDWRARGQGGSVTVPGVEHTHLYPNGYTVTDSDLGEQAGRDRERFLTLWGRLPH